MSETKKILVVDDDPDITDQLEQMLAPEGHEVTAAHSQAEAEEAVLAGRYDLAIVDLMMEEQDSGLVLSHEFKRLFPEMPVIMLTSVKAATGLSFAPESAEEESWVKVDCMLDKPVRAEKLLAEVERLLARAESKTAE